jgi:hypothetical protein
MRKLFWLWIALAVVAAVLLTAGVLYLSLSKP